MNKVVCKILLAVLWFADFESSAGLIRDASVYVDDSVATFSEWLASWVVMVRDRPDIN